MENPKVQNLKKPKQATLEPMLEMHRKDKGDVAILHLCGTLATHQAVETLKNKYLIACAMHKKILFNFENLAYFETASIPVIRNLQQLLNTSNGELRICSASPLVEKLFFHMCLNEDIEYFPSEAKAMENWSKLN